jgi:hypothetical protein
MGHDNKSVIKIAEGCIWEGPGWEIHLDHYSQEDTTYPCRHAIYLDPGDKRWVGPREDDSPRQFLTPRIAMAHNEGGFSGTGICIDCIIDAVANLQEKHQDKGGSDEDDEGGDIPA